MAYDEYQVTIGIECHVQLATNTKLFSPANNDARGAEPNQMTNEIDFGLPGMLPQLNWRAVELAVRAGKALGATIATESRFDRKHYFYPDLPKGYQTTQMYEPIILAGRIEVPQDDGSYATVRIHHAHLEEDAGKLTHHGDYSLVDLNRAGTPLIEIVSEPDIHSPAEARAYATELYRRMTYAGVTHGDLYHGNMRFDVNVSVAKKDADQLGTRAEVKNLNSFRSVERAAQYEIDRQIDVLERGELVVQETRGWSDDTGKTTSQRSKENAQDYRYMPDADIPPIILTPEQIAELQSDMPLLPNDYREAWRELSLDKSVVNTILAHQQHAALVSHVLERSGPKAAKRIANMMASNLDIEKMQSTGEIASVDAFCELADMIESSEISSNAATELFNELMTGAEQPRILAQQRHLLQNSNTDEITKIVESVLADPASAKAVADIKAGNDKAIGYLVGQVMKQSNGQANPGVAQQVIRERLQ